MTVRSVDYQIWRVTKSGALVEYTEGAIQGTWTKKTAMREFKAKYRGFKCLGYYGDQRGTGDRYAVVEVRARVIAK